MVCDNKTKIAIWVRVFNLLQFRNLGKDKKPYFDSLTELMNQNKELLVHTEL